MRSTDSHSLARIFPIFIIVFSLAVLAIALWANFGAPAASANPLRSIYVTLLTLVGILGVFVGIGLGFVHRRIDRLERQSGARPGGE